MSTSEDPDEMPHDAVFFQVLHFFAKTKTSDNSYLEFVICDPSIDTLVALWLAAKG